MNYGFNQRTYGFCTDRYCDAPETHTYLIEGRCGLCHDAYWDEQEFSQQNDFNMNDEDYGQNLYGRYMS